MIYGELSLFQVWTLKVTLQGGAPDTSDLWVGLETQLTIDISPIISS